MAAGAEHEEIESVHRPAVTDPGVVAPQGVWRQERLDPPAGGVADASLIIGYGDGGRLRGGLDLGHERVSWGGYKAQEILRMRLTKIRLRRTCSLPVGLRGGFYHRFVFFC